MTQQIKETTDEKIRDFTHPDLEEVIESISGHMIFQREERLIYNDKEVLFLVGYSSIETSCCGTGGCSFTLVPGYIVNWHNKKSNDGKTISEIEPIKDETEKNDIRNKIMSIENCSQVNFM